MDVDVEISMKPEKLDSSFDKGFDFHHILELKESHSDFKLVCGDEEFPCHKAILASRSMVIARGLAHGLDTEEGARATWVKL